MILIGLFNNSKNNILNNCVVEKNTKRVITFGKSNRILIYNFFLSTLMTKTGVHVQIMYIINILLLLLYFIYYNVYYYIIYCRVNNLDELQAMSLFMNDLNLHGLSRELVLAGWQHCSR